MAGALSYLHSKNILHGDLTGNNVLLTVTADDRRGFVAKVQHSKALHGLLWAERAIQACVMCW
jgi:tRNA A-37 threonylcarbamoyl transferase component Bud32